MPQNMIKMPFSEIFLNIQNYKYNCERLSFIFDGNFYKVKEAQFCAWKTGSSPKVGVKTVKSELTKLETAA